MAFTIKLLIVLIGLGLALLLKLLSSLFSDGKEKKVLDNLESEIISRISPKEDDGGQGQQ